MSSIDVTTLPSSMEELQLVNNDLLGRLADIGLWLLIVAAVIIGILIVRMLRK